MNSIREIGENIKNSKEFKGSVRYEEPMSVHTTMKVGGNASVYIVPLDVPSALIAAKECIRNGIRLVVAGGGSNIIVSDTGINGVVLSTEGLDSIEFHVNDKTEDLSVSEWKDKLPCAKGTKAQLTTGAGVTISNIVDFCAENGLLGLSSFSGLPGTAGGAVYMNARCYDKEASDVVSEVFYVDLDKIKTNEPCDIAKLVQIYHNDKKDWSYKHSPFFGKNVLIVGVSFNCIAAKGSGVRDFILSLNSSYVEDRRKKGHFKAPSAGSVFKNNRAFGKPSGMLIDEAGLKGLRIGGAMITPWHGNFIINDGNATAADIKKLVDTARNRVQERTGFVLEPEIIFV